MYNPTQDSETIKESIYWAYFPGDLHIESAYVPVECLEDVCLSGYDGFRFFAHWPVLDYGKDPEDCFIVVCAQDLFMISELSTGLAISSACPTLAEAKKDLHERLHCGSIHDSMLAEQYGLRRQVMTPERLRETITKRLLAGFRSPGILP